MGRLWRMLALGAALLVLQPAGIAHADPPLVALDEAARRLATGGYVMMMRHALTEPGIGDPPDFRLGDCATQRNLSADGREQARRTGAALRSHGIRIDVVRSSEWCRCRETAELAFGRYEAWPVLNSFFGRSDDMARGDALVRFARGIEPPANAVLVTHQVNIRAALGGNPLPAEIVVARWQDNALVPQFRFVADGRR